MASDLVVVLRRNLTGALRSSSLDEAARILELLKAEDPLSLETRGLELEVLVKSGALVEAGALAEQLLRLHPMSGRVHLLAGELAYKKRDWAVAAERFQESLRIHESWFTRRFLGKALTQAGRLDEAEPILLGLLRERPEVRLDLAWLYERRGDVRQALSHLTAHLAAHPGDGFAQAALQRLRARDLTPQEMVAEVRALEEHGEELPADLVAQACEAHLLTAQGEKARRLAAQAAPRLTPARRVSLGWVFYKAQMDDVAVELFLEGLAERWNDYKLLNALEAGAARCGKAEAVAAAYEALAPEHPGLYGRAKRMRARAAGVG